MIELRSQPRHTDAFISHKGQGQLNVTRATYIKISFNNIFLFYNNESFYYNYNEN